MTNQSDLAGYLDLSQAAVSKLKNAGVLPPPRGRTGYDRDQCRLAYIRHLRGSAAGRGGSAPGSLETERARLAKEQADLLERKNARERGDIVSRSEVDANVRGFVSLAVSRLSLVGARVAGADYRLRVKIEAAVKDALEDLVTIAGDDLHAAINGGNEAATKEDDDAE